MFIAVAFTITETWQQLNCPSADVWIKKMQYTNATDCYSAIKKNEIMPFEATWMDLKTVILSEVSQTEKDKYYISHMKSKR